MATERSYSAWLKRYCDYIQRLPVHLSSEQKLERFLTALAKDNVAASTQDQAFNAIIFFYKEVMGCELENVKRIFWSASGIDSGQQGVARVKTSTRR